MNWFSLILGLLIGWVIEWLIDLFYWRRRYRGCLESSAALQMKLKSAQAETARGRDALLDVARLQGELAAARARITGLEAQLAVYQAPQTDARAASLTQADRMAAIPVEPPAVAPVAGPAAAAAPDDLQIIEGIGPAIARLLFEAGIRTFADLAAAQPEALKSMLDAAGPRFRVAQPATWPRQADLAARGDWAGLKALQAQLQAGRE